jgi:hypothetical protein
LNTPDSFCNLSLQQQGFRRNRDVLRGNPIIQNVVKG